MGVSSKFTVTTGVSRTFDRSKATMPRNYKPQYASGFLTRNIQYCIYRSSVNSRGWLKTSALNLSHVTKKKRQLYSVTGKRVSQSNDST